MVVDDLVVLLVVRNVQIVVHFETRCSDSVHHVLLYAFIFSQCSFRQIVIEFDYCILDFLPLSRYKQGKQILQMSGRTR